jgi:hypothetical protein
MQYTRYNKKILACNNHQKIIILYHCISNQQFTNAIIINITNIIKIITIITILAASII